MLLILTDYASFVPLNVPEIPLLYMNILDHFVVLADIILPFVIDGFGNGILKTAFPLINLVLGPLVLFLDPTPKNSMKEQLDNRTMSAEVKRIVVTRRNCIYKMN